MIQRCNAIPLKIAINLSFGRYQQDDSEIYFEITEPRINWTLWEKHKGGGLSLFNSKTYYKTIVRQCNISIRTKKQINRTE